MKEGCFHEKVGSRRGLHAFQPLLAYDGRCRFGLCGFPDPFAHSASVLVMGPGGYRFSDYTKVGIPLTLVVLLIVLIVVPIFWPF